MHIVRLMCVNPRKILGIEGGSLGIDDIADIAIFDADESWTVDPEKLHSKSKNTCFKGMTLKGRVKYTLGKRKNSIRGQVSSDILEINKKDGYENVNG